MRKTRSLTPALTAAFSLVVAGAMIGTYASFAAGPNDPATECLIDLQTSDGTALPSRYTCTDGDACDADGATDGSCTINLQACPNVAGVSGCTVQPLRFARVNPRSLGVTLDHTGSTCGAFTVEQNLRKRGRKPSKPRKITGIAKGEARRVKDVDKARVQCVPCPTESCVPPTTTTTTTTNIPTTTSTIPPCGNGIVDQGETCDPGAAPNGCSGGTPFCNTTCSGCQENCSQLSFTLGAPTAYCGFPGMSDPAEAPISGELQDAMGMKTEAGDLGLGCLYIGGGIASVVPPGPTPDGSETLMGVADCSVNNITLAPADTGDVRNCTVGPKTTLKCTNGHPGTDGSGTCATDDDCTPVCVNGSGNECGTNEACTCVDGAPGTDGNGTCASNAQCGPSSSTGPPKLVCLPEPSCFFGGPLPISNTGLSTCVLNVIKDGAGGTADVAAGTADLTIPLKSWVYLTGIEEEYNPGATPPGNPCPLCDNGVCTAGKRAGLACTTNSDLKVSHDCPPEDHLFLAPLDVTLGPLSMSQVSRTADNLGTCGTTGCAEGLTNCCSGNGAASCSVDGDCEGIFCQGPPVQPQGGAFGRPEVRTIVQNGSPAAGGFDLTGKAATLASVFCIPPTGSALIDGSANLPGPGTTALGGTAKLR